MADGWHPENRKFVILPQLFCWFWWNFTSWHTLGLWALKAVQKFKVLEIQDGGRPSFWNMLNAVTPQPFNRFFYMKFGTMMHSDLPNLTGL